MAIDRLQATTELSAADKIALYSSGLGADAKATLTTLLEWLQAELTAADDMITQYEAPNLSGFVLQVTPFVAGGSVFLLVRPSGALAAGQITMPAQSASVDGQEVLVHFTQAVTTLTVSGNGASTGAAPTTIAAGGFFRLRYDAVNTTWYRVG